jgi:Uma2 family endonuclease
MAEPSRRRATYQDVLDAPTQQVAEIVDGVLYLSPRPALPHASVTSGLGGELIPPFGRGRGGPGGWILLFEPELHLDQDILVPDLAGWRRERLPQVENTAYLTLTPDWLCEVISPSTERFDRADKLPIYAAAGVRHVWLINPLQRTLEVLDLHEGRWLTIATYSRDQRVRAEPFDAIELDLAVLWADLPSLPGRVSEPVATYDVSSS